MEKTLFFQVSDYINDLKKFNKKSIKVEELSERFDSFVKDKFTVDIQTDKNQIKIEGLTKTQSDVITTIFESYVREYESKKQQENSKKASNNGFELVAEWSEDKVKKDKVKKPKEKSQKKKAAVVKFRGKVDVPSPTNK